MKYNDGDRIGENNILLIKRTKKNKFNQWLGEFECPLCGKTYEARIGDVSCGRKQSCGCAKKWKDITNQRFGRLTALYRTGETTKNGISYWHCKCDCGKEKDIRITTLLNGDSLSCGCYRTDLKANDLTNQRFGKLLAIERLDKKDSGNYFIWKCLCDCGRYTEVGSRSLVSGNTQTCGFCTHKSLGEEKIAIILDNLNIQYTREKTFTDCINPKTNRKLRFDFFLPEYNLCIEFDGEQHFRSVDYFGGEENFNKRKEYDKIKEDYCKNNNLTLKRINYLEINNINKDYIMKLTHERGNMSQDD